MDQKTEPKRPSLSPLARLRLNADVRIEKMKPLLSLTLFLLLVGCSRPKSHVSTWEGGLPEIVIIEQFTTNTVPRRSWTKSEEGAFSNTNALEHLAYYSELNGTLSVSHDKDYNDTWRIIAINHPTIVMKREGKTNRGKSEQ